MTVVEPCRGRLSQRKMEFGPFSSRLLFDQPHRLTEIDSWHEHIPFAFFAIDLIRPSTFIELGTWKGDSYCAFCQAVAALEVSTKCYAVDSWAGDVHTGAYPAEVFDELKAYHDPRYGAFSELVRNTFDEARAQFADGSIDLLHVDGCHTYDAVKHDFDTWLPKLSDRGVVLLHDTNVRDAPFGVWQLWEEVAGRYPNFEFTHGHGLGILAVGPSPTRELSNFLAFAEQHVAETRSFFFALGSRVASTARAERLSNELRGERHAVAELSSAVERAQADATRLREEREAVERGLRLDELRAEVDRLRREFARNSATLEAIYRSRTWRATAPVRRIGALRHRLSGLRGLRVRRSAAPLIPRAARKEPPRGTATAVEEPDAGDERPAISVLMPVYNTPPAILERAISSVVAQTYASWELCVCDDGDSEDVRRVLDRAVATDPRIRVDRSAGNSGISSATNRALELASGDVVAFLDHDDELAPDALLEVATAFAADPGLDAVYTDEDKLDVDGSVVEPFNKPDWSPFYFRGVMYVGHLLAIRRDVVTAVGGFDSHFDGVQDFELMLRVSERVRVIGHVAKPLYHWRKLPGSVAADPYAKEQVPALQVEAVTRHLRRQGISAVARAHRTLPHRVVLDSPPRSDWPRVSVIIAGDAGNAVDAIDVIRSASSYPASQLAVVDSTAAVDPASGVRSLETDDPFHVSRAWNAAAAVATADYLVFARGIDAVGTPTWLESLVWLLECEGVGVVGPVVVDASDAILTAGVALGSDGDVEDVMVGVARESDGYAGSLACVREVSAVRGACLATSRSMFSAVGGFREDYRAFGHDVDYCLRVRSAGRSVLVNPAAVLRAHAAPHDPEADVFDAALLCDVWRDTFRAGDPYSRQALGAAAVPAAQLDRTSA